jgi:ATP-dependent DNA helicase RecG
MEQLSFNFTYKSAQYLPLLSPDEIFERANRSLLSLLHEDKRSERKPARTHSKQLGEYFSMWANTVPEGGLVLLGMEDDGSFSGCSMLSGKELNDREKSDSNFCPDSRTHSKRIKVLNNKGQEGYVVLFRTFYREDKVVTDVSGSAFNKTRNQNVW